MREVGRAEGKARREKGVEASVVVAHLHGWREGVRQQHRTNIILTALLLYHGGLIESVQKQIMLVKVQATEVWTAQTSLRP